MNFFICLMVLATIITPFIFWIHSNRRKEREKLESFGNFGMISEEARDSLVPMPVFPKKKSTMEKLEMRMEMTRKTESDRITSAPPPIRPSSPPMPSIPPPPKFMWDIAKKPIPSTIVPPPDFIMNRQKPPSSKPKP